MRVARGLALVAALLATASVAMSVRLADEVVVLRRRCDTLEDATPKPLVCGWSSQQITLGSGGSFYAIGAASSVSGGTLWR